MLYSNYNDETHFGGLHDQYAEPQPRLLEVGRFAQVQYFTTNFSAKLHLHVHIKRSTMHVEFVCINYEERQEFFWNSPICTWYVLLLGAMYSHFSSSYGRYVIL